MRCYVGVGEVGRKIVRYEWDQGCGEGLYVDGPRSERREVRLVGGV